MTDAGTDWFLTMNAHIMILQLATFSLDEFHNLVVTFPIFIVPLDHRPFLLYELETVPVPIDDQDDHASSFSEVIVNKPYFAATDAAYI